jgi:hypothetical protein
LRYCGLKFQKMERFLVEATTKTPLVLCDSLTGLIHIQGRSIPQDADEFWNPIIHWFQNYMKSPASQTLVRIQLEYFNISSSKCLLHLLYRLNELKANGFSSIVEWIYHPDDIDMFEVGQDYAFMVKVPFEFKKVDLEEVMV